MFLTRACRYCTRSTGFRTPAQFLFRARSSAVLGAMSPALRALAKALLLVPQVLHLLFYFSLNCFDRGHLQSKFFHHLSRNRTRAVSFGVERKLHGSILTRRVGDSQTQPKRVVLQKRPLDAHVERSPSPVLRWLERVSLRVDSHNLSTIIPSRLSHARWLLFLFLFLDNRSRHLWFLFDDGARNHGFLFLLLQPNVIQQLLSRRAFIRGSDGERDEFVNVITLLFDGLQRRRRNPT